MYQRYTCKKFQLGNSNHHILLLRLLCYFNMQLGKHSRSLFLENIILHCSRHHFSYFGSKMAVNIFVLQSKIYEICFVYPFKHVSLYICAPTDYFERTSTVALSCHSFLTYLC